MAQYYLERNGQQTGPFEVSQLIPNGMTPDSLVWTSGMAGWTRAAEVPELAPMFAPPQPQYQQPYQQPYQQQAYQQPYQQAYQQPYQQAAYQQPGYGVGNKQKVDMFMMANRENFPAERMGYIQERLMMLDENSLNSISMLQFKSPMTALLLSLFLGCYGVDRFYIGDTGMGVGKLLTLGGCGIWAIIDWFMIQGATREKNFELLSAYI